MRPVSDLVFSNFAPIEASKYRIGKNDQLCTVEVAKGNVMSGVE